MRHCLLNFYITLLKKYSHYFKNITNEAFYKKQYFKNIAIIVPQIAIVFLYYFNWESSWSSSKISGITLWMPKSFDEYSKLTPTIHSKTQAQKKLFSISNLKLHYYYGLNSYYKGLWKKKQGKRKIQIIILIQTVAKSW